MLCSGGPNPSPSAVAGSVAEPAGADRRGRAGGGPYRARPAGPEQTRNTQRSMLLSSLFVAQRALKVLLPSPGRGPFLH